MLKRFILAAAVAAALIFLVGLWFTSQSSLPLTAGYKTTAFLIALFFGVVAGGMALFLPLLWRAGIVLGCGSSSLFLSSVIAQDHAFAPVVGVLIALSFASLAAVAAGLTFKDPFTARPRW